MSHPRRPAGTPGASIRARSDRACSRPGRAAAGAGLNSPITRERPSRAACGIADAPRQRVARRRGSGNPTTSAAACTAAMDLRLRGDGGEWAGADGFALARMTTDVRCARIRGKRREMRREREVRRHHRPPAPWRQPEKTKAPLPAPCEEVAEWTGLEPATSGVTGQHSNRLNYHSALESKLYCPLAVLSTLSCRRPVRTGGC